MTSIQQPGKSSLVIPDVSGMALIDAAQEYADHEFYVLPVRFGKHPGSIVGRHWPEKSSKDHDQIREWWKENPYAGIAIHTGKSGIVVFDLDIDKIPDELIWLKKGIFQRTRRTGERGHYVFYAGDEWFRSSSLKLKNGTVVGEIRSGNSVIMVEPSPHPSADDDGLYRWCSHE